jgi:imidazolonepropionase
VRFDRIWHNARLATMTGHAAHSGMPTLSGTAAGSGALGLIDDGVIACRDGKIVFAGQAKDAPRVVDSVEMIDCGGRLITPGLIDCHTHLVYAGDRAAEFERRLSGESYESIAQSGGGIVSTVRATREATESQLVEQSLVRLDALIAEGLTTIEIKSGYGLTETHERKQLKAAKKLEKLRDVRVTTTFLGAHALPPEYAERSEDYLREVCDVMMPALATDGLIDAVDVFCEQIGFSLDQTRRVFEAAREHRLRVKLHAEQLSNSHGAALAAEFRALSADHLEYLDEAGVVAMADAGLTAVLLPGAFYFVREKQLPPIELLRAHDVPIALATDCNPGTSPLTSMLLVMNMAATLFRLTVDECLIGVTRSAARALGMLDTIGTLEAGKWCDFAIWNVARPAELVYRMGANPLHSRVWRGR